MLAGKSELLIGTYESMKSMLIPVESLHCNVHTRRAHTKSCEYLIVGQPLGAGSGVAVGGHVFSRLEEPGWQPAVFIGFLVTHHFGCFVGDTVIYVGCRPGSTVVGSGFVLKRCRKRC